MTTETVILANGERVPADDPRVVSDREIVERHIANLSGRDTEALRAYIANLAHACGWTYAENIKRLAASRRSGK
jgi:hypothetical protein